MKKQVQVALGQLEVVELIRQLAEVEPAFLFRHALIQDTAQASLLKHERKHLHHMVAETMERLYRNSPDESAAVLAHHYAEAGEDAKTVEYGIRAGDAAARVYAHPEARIFYSLALDALGRLPDDDENRRQRIDMRIKQVSVSLRAAGPQVSLERMQEAEALLSSLAPEQADRARRARIHYWMGHAYVHANQPGKSIEYMRRVLPVAQELNDPELLAIPASVIGRALGIQGKAGQAYELLTQALGPLEKVENWHEWILAKAFSSVCLAMRGFYKQAVVEGEKAVARATEVQTQTGIGQSHVLLGLVHWMGRNWVAGLAECRIGQETAVRNGDHLILCLSVGVRAMINMRRGDYAASEKDVVELEEIRQRIGGRLLLTTWSNAEYAASLLEQQRTDEALALAVETEKEARASDDIFSQGLVARIRAQAAAETEPQRLEQAQEYLEASLRFLTEGDDRLEMARTHVAWGELLYARGQAGAAREHFAQAAAQFETSEMERELQETRMWIAS